MRISLGYASLVLCSANIVWASGPRYSKWYSKYLQIQTWGLRRRWVWRHSWALTTAAGSAKERTPCGNPIIKSCEEITVLESWARQSSGLALVFTCDVNRKKSNRDDSSNVAMRMLYTLHSSTWRGLRIFLAHSLFSKVNLPQELVILTVCVYVCSGAVLCFFLSRQFYSGHKGNHGKPIATPLHSMILWGSRAFPRGGRAGGNDVSCQDQCQWPLEQGPFNVA